MFHKTIITAALTVASLICLQTPANAQQSYGFSRILKGLARSNDHTNIQPTRLAADLRGGVIEVRMPDTAGTTYANYRFQWRFTDDISQLVPGRKYRFEMSGQRVGGTSDKNTNTAWMKSSNSGGVLAKRAGIESLKNTIEVTKTQSSVVAWPPAPNNHSHGTIELQGSPDNAESYFTFQFDFSSFPYAWNSKQCSFEVVYVYRKTASAATPVSLRPVAETVPTVRRSLPEAYNGVPNITGIYECETGTLRLTQTGDTLRGHFETPDALVRIDAVYQVWTAADEYGTVRERSGFIGTFRTRLSDGRTISGRTAVTFTGLTGQLKVSSSHYNENGLQTASVTVSR